MLLIRRTGAYFRVADPAWRNPLDGGYAARSGGRWNRPGSFPVVYLNRDRRVARCNVARKFLGRPYGPELLRAEEAPVLVQTSVPDSDCADIVTDGGCVAAGLPATYPLGANGEEIGWALCQPISEAAWAVGAGGIACRSAAPGAPADGEEMAWFEREGATPLQVVSRVGFDEWFWDRTT